MSCSLKKAGSTKECGRAFFHILEHEFVSRGGDLVASETERWGMRCCERDDRRRAGGAAAATDR